MATLAGLPRAGDDREQRQPGERRQEQAEERETDLQCSVSADTASTRWAHAAPLFPVRGLPAAPLARQGEPWT